MKKKLLAILLTVCMVVSLAPNVLAAEVTGLSGSGTEANPYVISNLAELKWFRDNVTVNNVQYRGQYIKLTADIDLNSEEWTPIGSKDSSFQGTFDGNGHTISNLVITGSNSYVGLFGRTNTTDEYPSEIKNFTLNNAKVSGSTEVGTVVGYSTNANVTYSNITVTGHIEVTGDAYVGGLAGKISGNCNNLTVNVDSSSFVHSNLRYSGGVIGWTGGVQTFDNLTSNATVTGDGKNVGGLIGIVYSGSTVQNVTFNGTVKVAEDCESYAAILGRWENSTYVGAGYPLTVTNAVSNGTVIVGGTTVTDYPLVGLAYKPELETASDSGVLVIDNTQVWPTSAAKIVSSDTIIEYATLAAAITAAEDGDTITLLRDTTLTEAITVDKTVTLDLAGFTVSMKDASSTTAYAIKNNGNLTITDNSTEGDGKITFMTTTPSATNAYASNTISNYGTITIINGTIENTSAGSACYALDNYAGSTANIKGGKLTAEKTAVRIFNWTDGEDNKATLNISGGEIISKDGYGVNVNAGNTPYVALSISGGTITTSDTDYNLAVYVINKGNAANNTINVTGGELNGYFALNGITSTTMASSNISVSGGTIEGVICYGTPAYGFISGGTYSDDSAASYLADGYTLESYTDGTGKTVYGVKIDPTQDVFVAEIDGVGYTTLQAAIDAAKANQTVTLLNNIAGSETIIVDESITLDLNGKTIENTASNSYVLKVTENSTFTLTDNTTDASGFVKGVKGINVTTGSSMIMNGGNVVATGANGAGIQVYGSSVIMNGGSVTAEYGAILMYSNGDTRGTFTMEGGKLSSTYPAIYANGSDDWDNVDVTINDGEITSEDIAIFWPADGKLAIHDGKITGKTAVYVKSGSLEITDGELIATGEKKNYEHKVSGAVTTGDALVIENVGDSGYEAITSVSISGGTFTSANASAVASYTAGNDGVDAIIGFIKGGTYSDKSAEAYLAEGYTLESYEDSEGRTVYGVEPTYTVTITIPGGATIVVKDSEGNEIAAEGNGTYELVNGTYTYSVSKDGYHTKTGSFTVDDEPLTITVDLAVINYYTITYTDGVDGIEVFPDYVFANREEGSATPTISNPTRFGYIFTGWTPEVSATVTGNVVYTATWLYNPPYIPVVPTSYSITVEDAANGDVSADRSSATSGQTVTISVDPDTGYVLETLVVLDRSGKEVALTRVSENKYSFKMPASKVTVYATFMEDNTMLNYFVDVFAGDYYYDAVLWAVENNITNGTSSTTFSPDMTCTRAQAVTFLWRAAGSPEPVTSTMPFEDVSADAYYYKAVLWAVENGITNGTSATTFSPDADCTRAQIVTFLWRSQQSPANNAANPFTDVAEDAYYAKAVLWAVENGITNGTSATTFSPDNDCTRAQIVTFLYRCMGDK